MGNETALAREGEEEEEGEEGEDQNVRRAWGRRRETGDIGLKIQHLPIRHLTFRPTFLFPNLKASRLTEELHWGLNRR